jgi:DNA-binding response OmpR family regulator
VALLTAFPAAEENWQQMGADKMLVKPMHTRVLLEQLEKLLVSHENKLAKGTRAKKSAPAKKAPEKKAPAKKASAAKTPAKKTVVKASTKKSAKKVSRKK